jgi:hypothetical protein
MLKNNQENRRYHYINLLLILILGLAPLLWFKEGCLIKSEDLSIPLSLGEWQTYLYSWFNQRATGTYPIDNFAALFFLLMPSALQKIGFSIITSQKIHFIFWFMLSGFSLYYLLCALRKGKTPHPLLVLPAISFYMFNLYLEPVWLGFNIANLSAYAGLPLLAGLFLNGLRTGKMLKYLSLAGLVGVLLSGVGVNPPIMYVVFLFFFFWVVYSLIMQVWLKKSVSLRRFIGFLVLFIMVLGVINVFWIYPQAMRLKNTAEIKPLSDYKASVEEGIKERSKYTSLLNVLRFQAAWTWHEDYEDDPYVLYSDFYKKNNFFVFLSLLPVVLIFISVFCLRDNEYLPFFIILSFLGIIFSVGVHPPFGGFNLFFIKNIPGFWMIRSPWYKWSLFTTLGFSVLLYFVMAYLVKLAGEKKGRSVKLSGIILAVFILLYAYPVLTGKMFTTKEERHYIPPNYIQIPEYAFEAADWLNSQPEYFRIMVLHSVSRRITTWGYAGYEPVLAYFTNKPIITPIMQASFGSPYSIPNFENLLYSWLYVDKYYIDEKEKREHIYTQDSPYIASKILPLFNIKYLLYESDLRWDFYDRYESPEFVEEKLNLQQGIKEAKTFGKWKFYLLNNTLSHGFLTNKVNIISGDLAAYEALSRTNIFEYNNIFEKQARESFLAEINSRGLINKVIYYNQAHLPANYKAAGYLLLDTDNEDIFYKKEVADEAALKKIRIDFEDSSLETDNDKKDLYYFKNNKVPLTAEINLKDKRALRVNLKVMAYSQTNDRFIDVYLNDKVLKKVYVKTNTPVLIRLEALELKPGRNFLKFIANDSEVNRQLALSRQMDIYMNEYNCSLILDEALSGKVSLYPKPLNQIGRLPAAITLKAGQRSLSLAYSKSSLEYKSPIHNFSRGENRISFLQYQDEGYYLLLGPEFTAPAEILNLQEEQLSPVHFELKDKKYQKKWQFLFFLESYDPYWQTALKEAHHGKASYENHFIADGYANGWLLDGQQKVGQPLTLVIKYSVQRQFWAGLAISLTLFIFCLLGLLFSWADRRSK